MKVYFLLALCVIFPVFAQMLMKKGMNQVGEFTSSNIFNLKFFVEAFSNPYVIMGEIFYVVTALFWLIVISKLQVSKAYPAVSLSYVIVILAGYFFLGEPLTMKKLLGGLIILIGVYVIFSK